jgi:hypothetical protein
LLTLESPYNISWGGVSINPLDAILQLVAEETTAIAALALVLSTLAIDT